MKKVRKVINVIVDILVILVLLISIMVVVLALTSKSSGIPNLFGYAPLSVQSDSMKSTLNEGDLIFSKVSTDLNDKFKVDDIVSFYQNIGGEERLNTHRIVEIVQEDGIEKYRTQGDNKDTNPEPDEELKNPSEILAVYTGTRIPGAGRVLSFIRTQLGFFLCILLPIAAAETVASSELTEEQKQRAIAEYLAQQKAQVEEQKQQDGDGEV